MNRLAALTLVLAAGLPLLGGCRTIETRTEERTRDMALEGWVRDFMGRLWEFAIKLREVEKAQGRAEVEFKPPAFLSAAGGGLLSLIPGGAAGAAGGLGTVGSLILAWWQTRGKQREAAERAEADTAAREAAATADEFERVAKLEQDEATPERACRIADRLARVKESAAGRQEMVGVRARLARLRRKPVKVAA